MRATLNVPIKMKKKNILFLNKAAFREYLKEKDKTFKLKQLL